MRVDKNKVELMLARNAMSWQDAATAYGCTVANLRRMTMVDKVYVKTLGRLAKVLKCDIADILADEDAGHSKQLTSSDAARVLNDAVNALLNSGMSAETVIAALASVRRRVDAIRVIKG